MRLNYTAQFESPIVDFLEHDENIYDHQTFEILQFLSEAYSFNNQRIQSVGRKYAFGANPLYVKSQARYLLFCIGSNSDTESMMRIYGSARCRGKCCINLFNGSHGTWKTKIILTSVDQPIWLLRAGILLAKARREEE